MIFKRHELNTDNVGTGAAGLMEGGTVPLAPPATKPTHGSPCFPLLPILSFDHVFVLALAMQRWYGLATALTTPPRTELAVLRGARGESRSCTLAIRHALARQLLERRTPRSSGPDATSSSLMSSKLNNLK